MDDWTWLNPLPQGNSLHAAAARGAEIWAVGEHGAAVSSDDGGATWMVHDTGVAATLWDVAAGSSVWAVGERGLALRTEDGRSWATVPTGTTAGLNEVWLAADGTAWVAGDDGLYAGDAAGLHRVGGLPEARWMAVAGTASGAVVAIAPAGVVAVIADGRPTVTQVGDGKLPMTFDPRGDIDVAVDGERVRAVIDAKLIAGSDDGGRTWTSVDPPFLANRVAIIGSSTYALAAPGRFYRSVDGGAFAKVAAANEPLSDLVPVGAALWAPGVDGRIVRLSEGGGLVFASGFHAVELRVLVANGQALWLGGCPTREVRPSLTKNGPLLRSSDGGATWEEVPGPDGCVNALWSAGDVLLAGTSRELLRSEDGGRSLSVVAVPGKGYGVTDLAGTPDLLVAGLVGEPGVTSSADGGETWRPPATNLSTILGVAVAGGRAFAVGESGGVHRSDDGGITWSTLRPDGRTHRWLGVAARSAEEVVIVGQGPRGAALLVSVDGGATLTEVDTWADGTKLGFAGFAQVAYGAGEYWAVGTDGAVARSTDGRAWTAAPAPTDQRLMDVDMVGSDVLVVGREATLLEHAPRSIP